MPAGRDSKDDVMRMRFLVKGAGLAALSTLLWLSGASAAAILAGPSYAAQNSPVRLASLQLPAGSGKTRFETATAQHELTPSAIRGQANESSVENPRGALPRPAVMPPLMVRNPFLSKAP